MDDPEIDPRIGQTFHHYKILAQIGQGGMSIVYRGDDEQLGRQVAIKFLHPFLVNNKECLKRLSREARTVAQLCHPNIVQVFDYDHEAYIVTELVDGITLQELARLYDVAQVPELGALITLTIAEALEYAHTQGVIHRDIKPENIMVRRDGTLKIMDFGIAQVMNQESLTLTGTLLGSPAHMAPETIEGKPTDVRSDIFSLTTVLYWLTTGKLPFTGQSAHTILKAIVDGRCSPPQQVSLKICDGLNAVIAKGMATKPEERFQTAQELADALNETLVDLGIEPNTTQLQHILANPETEIVQFKEDIEKIETSRAAELKSKGQTAKSMSLLGRILANDPNNLTIQTALNDYKNRPARTWKKWILLTIGFLGILSWFLWPRHKQQQATVIVKRQLTQHTAEPAPIIATAKSDKPLMGAATIIIDPFADVYVDDKLIEKNTSKLTIPLQIGKHTLSFKHEYAVTQKHVIEIVDPDQIQKVNIQLVKAKPSMLIVKSNVDADIAVADIYKGTTSASMTRPVVIHIPDRQTFTDLDVVVSKTGYQPSINHWHFIAGRTHEVNIELKPNDLSDTSH